uniref:Poly [ADP-ribose] polymerase n=1 Tax=Neogobius melanostomus TaxID=47308 RepID=A0A8C6SIB4_9GOBI
QGERFSGETLQVNRKKNVNATLGIKHLSRFTGVFSKVVSTSSSHETKMGGVSVQVITGDITKETTDVIVNSSNEKFSLKSGVSKAILEAAGPAVENECQTLAERRDVLTQPGNLRCQKILHLVGQTDLGKIQVCVRDALLLCIKHKLRSVAFPAIGTGNPAPNHLPESWDSMNTSGTKAIALTPGSAEYVTVEQLFKASCNKTITKIERIQNPVLWQSLQIKRRAMDQKNGHSNNERRLFHGTSADTVEFINEHGFNRSYAGKNATAYGNGTYFAVNASYSSSDTYSRPGANGDKLMYLCSVLTGDFTTGASGMIDAPLKKSGSIDRFDSVVDNTTRPSMFIIFHDSHAYPEYLITFR